MAAGAAEASGVALSHWPVLPVLVPLCAAPVCSLLRQARLAWAFASLVCAATFATSLHLFNLVWEKGSLVYSMGGWTAPWGIEYRLDVLNAGMLVLVSGVASLVILGSRSSILSEVPANRHGLFFTCWVLCLTGLLGISITGDAFNVFVFLEVSSLSTYALVAMGRDPRALTAAFRYLIMGTIGATFILIGIGLLYMMTGTLNMLDLARRIPEVSSTQTVRAAFAFLTVGISLKLALFPMHRWLPNAYTYSPSAVSAFLAATATKVALYLLLRFFFTIFGVGFSYGEMGLDKVLGFMSLLAMVGASLSAVFKMNAKRVLAYSSVAQIGYMTFAVSLGTPEGLAAGMLHMFNHALMKGCLFLAMGAIVLRIGCARGVNIAGVGRRMPWTCGAFIVGALSLIGVPGTAGFVSKWHLISAAIAAEHWWAVGVILVTSLLAVIYLGKIIEKLFLADPSEVALKAVEVPIPYRIALWTAALTNIYFGLFTHWSVGTATRAAAMLLEGTP